MFVLIKEQPVSGYILSFNRLSKGNLMNTQENLDLPLTKWDKIASDDWWKFQRQRNKDEWMRIAVTARHCDPGKILEIGCGNGDLYTYLASWGHEIYGVDISQVAICKATARCLDLGIKGVFAVSDGGAIPLADSSFDTIILPEVIEHVENPTPILLEARRLCKHDGNIIITVPNENLIPDDDHKTIFTADSLKKLASQNFGGDVHPIQGLPVQWLGVKAKNRKNNSEDINYPGHVKSIKEYFKVVVPEYLDADENKVSVIIPTYNRSNYIECSLNSIFAQTYKNIEIIVVNDGSTDNTSEIISKYPQVIYLEQENKGKSSAINCALRVATGDFIWIMDDDDIANPYKAEMQVRQFVKNPDVGIIGTELCVINADNSAVISMFKGPSCHEDDILYHMLEECVLSGVSTMIRRECFSRVGVYDERLTRSVDYEMHLRIAFRHKAKIINFPAVLMRAHDGVRGAGTAAFNASEMKHKWKESNRRIFENLYEKQELGDYYPALRQSPGNGFHKISALYLRILGLVANSNPDAALNDFNTMGLLINKLSKKYVFPDEMAACMEMIFKISPKITKLLIENELFDLYSINQKTIRSIVKLSTVAMGREKWFQFKRKKLSAQILFDKDIMAYIFNRVCNKVFIR